MSPASAQPPTVPLRDTQPDTFQIPAGSTGESALPAQTVPIGPRADHTVGIFYFLWQSGSDSDNGKNAPYDVTRILAVDPNNPAWGPRHAFHFWGEPLFGYYAIEDPWILHKHAQMLTDAGVDVIILDVTNALTYPVAYLALCKFYTEMRQQGNGTGRYVNNSGRNDIVAAKINQGKQNIYFYARTDKPLTPPDTASEWMMLLFNMCFPRGTMTYTWALRQGIWQGKTQTVL